jgi:hypothetical protein
MCQNVCKPCIVVVAAVVVAVTLGVAAAQGDAARSVPAGGLFGPVRNLFSGSRFYQASFFGQLFFAQKFRTNFA